MFFFEGEITSDEFSEPVEMREDRTGVTEIKFCRYGRSDLLLEA